ncbi:MAG: hypothetical protein IJ123_03685 [Blautia sp.]|nr:hypothetical protein [Blautia sp.]
MLFKVSGCQSGIPMQTTGMKGGRTYNPYVYSEQGVAMLTSALHTDKAIEASIMIMEAFVEMSHFIEASGTSERGYKALTHVPEASKK